MTRSTRIVDDAWSKIQDRDGPGPTKGRFAGDAQARAALEKGEKLDLPRAKVFLH